MRRGELTLRILEIFTELITVPVDYFISIIELSGKPTISKALFSIDKRLAERDSRAAYFQNLRQINELIYKLKKGGLIEQKAGVLPLLTNKGKKVFEELKGKIYKGYLPAVSKYRKEADDELKIVIFDIPENFRRKRDWLRGVLIFLDYKMLQKSVWLGSGQIPLLLVTDLKDLNLLDYVHIFSVKKKGTIV